VLDVGSTDARAMQISRGGMPSGALSIPCRYVHSPSEMIDMDDYTQALTLLTGLLSREIKLEKK
jgi:endoglucanase